MKRIVLSPPLISSMHRHARDAYPDECCGFLLSPAREPERSEERQVIAIAPTENRSVETRRSRFLIPADDLAAAERTAAEDEQVVCGFYHSHPDGPARPSWSDQDHAWPWYVYLILSSAAHGPPGSVGAYQLDPDRRELRQVRWATASSSRGARGGPRREARATAGSARW